MFVSDRISGGETRRRRESLTAHVISIQPAVAPPVRLLLLLLLQLNSPSSGCFMDRHGSDAGTGCLDSCFLLDRRNLWSRNTPAPDPPSPFPPSSPTLKEGLWLHLDPAKRPAVPAGWSARREPCMPTPGPGFMRQPPSHSPHLFIYLYKPVTGAAPALDTVSGPGCGGGSASSQLLPDRAGSGL